MIVWGLDFDGFCFGWYWLGGVLCFEWGFGFGGCLFLWVGCFGFEFGGLADVWVFCCVGLVCFGCGVCGYGLGGCWVVFWCSCFLRVWIGVGFWCFRVLGVVLICLGGWLGCLCVVVLDFPV